MKPVGPRTTLADFDAFLAEPGLRLEAVVIGGAALGLLGIISRPTKDCDVLAPPLSVELRAAVAPCDRGFDLADCVALRPTRAELATVRPWLEYQDANEEWPTHVGNVLADLELRIAEEARRGL